MTHEVSEFDWHRKSLWFSPRPFVQSWLQVILGLSLSPHPLYREILPTATSLFDNYKWHTCSPLSCSSGTLSGCLRSFNLQIYVMMMNSSVDWNLKEPLCPIPTTPAQCNLPFHTWDHWYYWTTELWRVYGYNKWVEGEAVTQIFCWS